MVWARKKTPHPAEGLGNAISRLEAKTGYKVKPEDLLIGEDERFVDWCERLGDEGLELDNGRPFSLKDRPALRSVYEAIPTTRAEAHKKTLVVMKATQIGMTVWEVLADIYMAVKWEPVTLGMFMPDQTTALHKSEHRFMNFVRSAPKLYKRLVTPRILPDGNTVGGGEGNVLTRTIGKSILLFRWTSGKVTTESVPMDIVSLDEVQEMFLADIDKVRRRMGDSDIAFCLMLSTANMPELDIDYWYRLGTQEVWHTRCPHCGALSDLSDPAVNFPKLSVIYNTGQYADVEMNEYFWACPICRGLIENPQLGELVVTNPMPNPSIRSFLLPRTVSPRMTAREAAEDWARAKTGDQKKNAYNRMLARPYIDADQLPVTMSHCLAAAAKGVAAGLVWQTSGRNCYMGIDQMGGFNAVIIKKRLPNGQQAVVHVEAVFDNDPFARCSQLMEDFGVEVCVVEQLPNVNDARRFANERKNQGRVFLASYADLRDDAMVWGDALTRNDRKTAEEDRSRYMVTLQQYKCMQTALYRIRDAFCLFPDPDALEQDVIENGVKRRIPIVRDWVFNHFTKTAIVVQEVNDKAMERKLKSKVIKIGIDPHFSFANMLCDVAWARAYGTATFILPDAAMPAGHAERAAAVEANMPGLPTHVVAMIQAPVPGTCGACIAYPKTGPTLEPQGLCSARNIFTGSVSAACPFFTARS